MKHMVMAMVMVGVMVSAVAYAQLGPSGATAQIIDLQQQDNAQRQRIYPNTRQFMGGRVQPMPSGAYDVNGLLLSPNYTGYVRPVVKTPMYQVPGQN